MHETQGPFRIVGFGGRNWLLLLASVQVLMAAEQATARKAGTCPTTAGTRSALERRGFMEQSGVRRYLGVSTAATELKRFVGRQNSSLAVPPMDQFI